MEIVNLIWICSDTFRNDHLGCMGRRNVKTPCLDKLASKGILFKEAYAEGLPTGPERIVHMTGKFTLPFRGWEPLGSEDITMAEHLRGMGFRTALMSDTYHMFKPNYNFHRGFDEWRWIRGQESDPYVSARRGDDAWSYLPARTQDIPLERKHASREDFTAALRQYLHNVADRGEDESEYFPARTVGEGIRWLEDNQDADRFLLWMELFDPHEPWDPPEKYYRMYSNPEYRGPKIIAPWFHSILAEDYTDEELKHVRALYAGEVSLVDHWVGELVDKVHRLGLDDETAILFTSDHGTMLGERGCVTKDTKIKNTMSQYIANVPLIIGHPDGPRGVELDQCVWSPDFLPTCCEILGVDPPPSVHGRSFWNLVEDRGADGRDYIVSGFRRREYYYVVDDEWRFVSNARSAPDELYRKETDPDEVQNLASQHPEVCEMMRDHLGSFFREAASLNP